MGHSWLDAFTELRANAALRDPRGDTVSAGILSIQGGGSGDLVAGVDALFDPRAAAVAPVTQATAGVRAVLGPAALGYGVVFPGRAQVEENYCGTNQSKTVNATHIQQHAFTFEWDSPCHCFKLTATVQVSECGNVTPKLLLDFAGLGAGGH